MTRFLLALAALAVTTAPLAAQGVNLKNGNFYISYIDIEAPGVEINRTYNSKSTHDGMLGYGWGWRYGTRLYPIGDGSVVVQEHGGGGRTWYEPAFPDPDAIADAIDEIVAARRASGDLRAPNAVAEFRADLRDNSELRFVWWQRFANAGTLAPPTSLEGTVWTSGRRGFQRVTRTAAGYHRESGNTDEWFDAEGRLVRIDDGDGDRTLRYRDGRLAEIESDAGGTITFTLDDDGRIATATSEGHQALLEYDERGDLVHSVDTEGYRYSFEYDDSHNLTTIHYQDGTTRRLEYDPDSYYVTRHQEPDGTVTRYGYANGQTADGAKDPDRYSTQVIQQGRDGSETISTYEYEIRTSESGARYTYRTATTINGIRTETTYNECCGQPLAIRRGDRETRFVYDPRGNLVRKANEQEVLVNEYDLDLNKLTTVERWTPGESELLERHSFEYDAEGNLTRAEHSGGDWAELTYNDAGRIVRMEQEEGVLTFEYGPRGKPIRITLDSGDAIAVSYDDAGEIERVTPTGSASAGLSVTRQFQSLLALVQPAGVDLGM